MIDNMKPTLFRPTYAVAPEPPPKQKGYDERVKEIMDEHRASLQRRWEHAAGFGKGEL